jgi:hypothetical protein
MRESVTAAMKNVMIVENSSFWILTPPYRPPEKSNAEILTFGTNTVNRYRIIAFVTIENNPRVSRFMGKLMTFNIGLMMRSSNVRENPAIKSVIKPPETMKPGRICVNKNMASIWTTVERRKPFIIKMKGIKSTTSITGIKSRIERRLLILLIHLIPSILSL